MARGRSKNVKKKPLQKFKLGLATTHSQEEAIARLLDSDDDPTSPSPTDDYTFLANDSTSLANDSTSLANDFTSLVNDSTSLADDSTSLTDDPPVDSGTPGSRKHHMDSSISQFDVKGEIGHEKSNETANKIQKKRRLPTKGKDSVWESFNLETNSDGKVTLAKCKSCGKTVSHQAQRLKKHLKESCSGAPCKIAASCSTANLFPDDPAKNISNQTVKQSDIRGFVKTVNSTTKQELDWLLGRFIFSSNLPFNIVSHPSFKQFVKALNPAYELPSRETVRTTILDRIYEEVIEERKKELQDKGGVLMQDGWSTNQTKPVISHCFSTMDKTYFISAEDTGSERKDSNFCLSLLEKAIHDCEETYGAKIIGVVTDNCSTMIAMKNELLRKHPQLEAYGCNSHLHDLNGKKFTNKDLQDKVGHVQRYMKNHHFASGMLSDLNGKRPVLPVSTRWNSQIDSFLNFIENQAKYLEIIRKAKVPTATNDKASFLKAKEIIEDASLYNDVKNAVKILKPICVALDKTQREKCNLADSSEMWLKLDHELPDEIISNSYYKKQRELGMTPLSCAAHILHPQYRGVGLSCEDKERGISWIKGKNEFYLVLVAALSQNNQNYFYKDYLSETLINNMTPSSWWQAASKDCVPEGMIELIQKVFTFPASTGSIERAFSTLGQIMTDQRNQISVESASKLCCINNFIKLQEERPAQQRNKRKFELVE